MEETPRDDQPHPPPGVVIPPGHEYATVGDTPKEFTEGVLMRAFTDYSVALGLERNGYLALGTGVLVRKRGHYGILTARHCLHACSPEVRLGSKDGDTLWLCLERGRMIKVPPQEAMEHRLTKPDCEEFGPDLTFIEILPQDRIGTFKAVGTFWSLDQDPEDFITKYGKPLTPIVTAGFPAVYSSSVRDGLRIRQQLKHMIYQNAIKDGAVFERRGWDYLDSTMYYGGNPDLPDSFGGVSGGPVWGMELGRNKSDGKWTLRDHALIGITFYEIFRKGDEGSLRAHFIKSIYDLAWFWLGEISTENKTVTQFPRTYREAGRINNASSSDFFTLRFLVVRLSTIARACFRIASGAGFVSAGLLCPVIEGSAATACRATSSPTWV